MIQNKCQECGASIKLRPNNHILCPKCWRLTQNIRWNKMNYEGRIFAMEILPNRQAKISFDIEIDEDQVDDFKQKFCDNKSLKIDISDKWRWRI